jgi:V/A-type H+/Na+-transporting ATPase subunit A
VSGGDARVVRVTGSLVEGRPLVGAQLYELVRVGRRGLLGEVIRVSGDRATMQVYEETSGLCLGEPVVSSGAPLAIQLGPGLLGSIIDGLGRPLDRIAAQQGAFVEPGSDVPTLDVERRWRFVPARKPGDQVEPGDVLGEVEERPGLPHRIMVPPEVSGVLAELTAGEYTVKQPVGRLASGRELFLAQPWPVRAPRPVRQRLGDDRPMISGQRIFDLLFPVAEGGTVAVPGGFGTGKTIIEQSLAKYAEADIIVYIGCGERGNEMAELLDEFPRLTDPRTGRPLLERTVMVVNTSNMPVAAREASVYLGISIGEYFRDMGYRVVLLADSLSRWAEALREISARLQELPGEEGYPTYLASRLGRFFERAGRVTCLGRPERSACLTAIAAISPPGGDMSEPVTQSALRVVGGVWALDAGLAHQRQFPAVDWETSYSLYAERTLPWFEEHGGEGWGAARRDLMTLLARDRELREIAGLIGPDALQPADRLLLEIARLARQAVLSQSAFDPADAFSSVTKTHRLATLVTRAATRAGQAVQAGASLASLDLAALRSALLAVRDAPAEAVEAAAANADRILEQLGTSGGSAP